MESDLQISVKGLPDDLGDVVGTVVMKVVSSLERLGGGLDLRRMHRIIVAKDFARELAELSAATASGRPITHTDEEYAVAVAKVMILPRGEDYEIVPVISANHALALLAPEDAGSDVEGTDQAAESFSSELFNMVLHGLHHELCHVHDDNKKIDALSAFMLRHSYWGKDMYIRPLAESCWSEYIANFLSSATAGAASLEAMTKSFGDAILRTKPHIDGEIRAYRLHADLVQLLDIFQRHGEFLARSAAYVLGYADGLDVPLDELSAETSERLSGSYFESTLVAMHEALREMRQSYPHNWRDLSVYDDLAMVLERYYADMGLILSSSADGQVYVDIPLTPETTP